MRWSPVLLGLLLALGLAAGRPVLISKRDVTPNGLTSTLLPSTSSSLPTSSPTTTPTTAQTSTTPTPPTTFLTTPSPMPLTVFPTTPSEISLTTQEKMPLTNSLPLYSDFNVTEAQLGALLTLSPLTPSPTAAPPFSTTQPSTSDDTSEAAPVVDDTPLTSTVATATMLEMRLAPTGSADAVELSELGDEYYNMTNCTNEYCVSDEEYLDLMLDYIFPTTWEWVFITLHGLVFVVGLVGNALVCVAVYRNQSMRTVTNYFIVNLAVADFLVILLCLPPTVLWDVTETWFMGTALCKIVLYFQTVSVTVSVLTLTFISIDRWYAICLPLKFKSTVSRAKKAIFLIWVLALLFDMPELVVLETKKKDLSLETVYFTQCIPSWGNVSDTTFHIVKTLFLYVFPLSFITVAYCHIVKVLWSKNNIPGHSETLKFCANSCNGNGTATRRGINRSVSANQSSAAQILSRRKAAKMLVAVDVMFMVCYLPVHAYSLLRYTMDIPQTEATTTFAMLSHWLCYANSAINPVIYNFMSGKFRQEFRRAFHECACASWAGCRPLGPVHPEGSGVGSGALGKRAGALGGGGGGGVNGKHSANMHISLTHEIDLEMIELNRPSNRSERRRIASYRDHI